MIHAKVLFHGLALRNLLRLLVKYADDAWLMRGWWSLVSGGSSRIILPYPNSCLLGQETNHPQWQTRDMMW
jgi:hypothetical protein